jgi:hypothetical protein
MQPFLERLALTLLQRHGHALEHVAVVLPGKRAGLYLRKYLAESARSTIWSPRIYDVGGFMEEISGMRQGGTMEMLFLLFEAHTKLMGSNAGSLDEFMQWAPTTLRDMSEVDSHLLDLGSVYRDLRSYHEIEEWSFNLERTSEGQERMLQHWRHTGALHLALESLMQERRVGTSGHVARTAVARLGAGKWTPNWDTVYFAGLNALEPATTAVVKTLQDKGSATVAWDADTYFLNDPMQEAGLYLRRSIKDLGAGVIQPVDDILTKQREFIHVTVPNGIAQATYAGNYLAALDPEERKKTAVVLADEGLLMPLLTALPADIGPVNVTMGMPLSALPIHGCTEAFIAIHTHFLKHGSFHLADVERLLLHPFLHQAGATARTIGLLREARQDRLQASEVLAAARKGDMLIHGSMISSLEPMDQVWGQMPYRMAMLLNWAKQGCGEDRYRMEQLFQMARLQRRLDQGLERSGMAAIDISTYTTLRERLLREERIGFFGEPLQGLQIMGLLETRAIDHEHILVLGASEGSLPRSTGQQSWIPFDIRRTYGLPLRADADAISAYHFARMARSTSQLVLVHGAGNGQDPGEPSRFILQWEHELAENSATRFQTVACSSPFVARPSPSIQVVKSQPVLERLVRICEKGLSPSAFGAWLRCPLDFYFTRVLGIREANEVDGRLGSDVLGEAVHAVLEDIVRPLLGKPYEATALRREIGNVHGRLIDRLSGSFARTTLEQGHFRLRIEMASKAIEAHLAKEAQRSALEPSIPLALELDLDVELMPGVRIRGRCDRIESRGGIHHILDLKTGSVKAEDLRISGVDREIFGAKRGYALQLLVYAWAYLVQNPGMDRVRAGIIPIQKASESEGLLLTIAKEQDIHRSMLPDITDLLKTLALEILDTGTPMVHKPESQYCSVCLTA